MVKKNVSENSSFHETFGITVTEWSRIIDEANEAWNSGIDEFDELVTNFVPGLNKNQLMRVCALVRARETSWMFKLRARSMKGMLEQLFSGTTQSTVKKKKGRGK